MPTPNSLTDQQEADAEGVTVRTIAQRRVRARAREQKERLHLLVRDAAREVGGDVCAVRDHLAAAGTVLGCSTIRYILGG